MKKLRRILIMLRQVVASPGFFWLTLGLFVVESIWIALVGRYPQAFDEQFHFGVIQLHAQQWWPFFASHPSGADSFGPISRDPSFLYHYLFSFVYRLLRVVVSSQTTQIVILRLINVVLAACAFVIFRQVLSEMKLSAAKSHVILALVALLPVYPLLAGEINYDNLLVPLTAWIFLLSIRLYKDYQRHAGLDWAGTAWLVVLMMLSATVKLPFLPIFLGIVLFFAPIVWRERRSARLEIKAAYGRATRLSKAVFIGVTIVAGILFAGSYGVNLVRYHTTSPKCHKVLSVQQCSAYGPWLRDYMYKQSRVAPSVVAIATYPESWVRYMMRESFFTIYSKFGKPPVVLYFAAPQLPLIYSVGWFWFWLMLIMFVISLPFLWRDKVTRLVLIPAALYVAALFAVDVGSFISTAHVVAVHGRYLFPVLVPLLGCVALGYERLLGKLGASVRPMVRGVMGLAVGLTVIIFIIYGGFTTYLVRSNHDWFWPQSKLAQRVSGKARVVLRGIVLTD